MSPPGAPRPPTGRRVVVDGSNLATEGRSTPSLAQLDEAVRAFHAERPNDEIIVVVDASFGYRIDESERKIFEEAEEAGEIVSPPAGAIGRGDGFLLRIADRIDADVLSNDSFQEFHGEYVWLFEEGRLLGGKPVPNVGWIFTPRTPVRGPKSRVATRDADRARRRAAAASPPEPTAAAIAEATAEAISPAPARSSRRGRRRGSRAGAGAGAAAAVEGTATAEAEVEGGGPVALPRGPQAINEPLPFITFIADHPLGTEVEGVVEGFTSHGAFVIAGGARCYAPVSGLGDPPPRSAKEVLTKGETRTFVIQALDPPRRGIELALPGLAKVAGAPTEETVEAEIDAGAQPVQPAGASDAPAAKPRRGRKKAASPGAGEEALSARETASDAPAAGEPGPAAGEPAAKPRRGRKKAAAQVVGGEAPADAGGPAVAPAPVAGPAAGKAGVEAEPAGDVARPRRARARAGAPAAAELGPETAVTPRPRGGRRRPAPAEVVGSEPAPAPAPAGTRPRRSRTAPPAPVEGGRSAPDRSGTAPPAGHAVPPEAAPPATPTAPERPERPRRSTVRGAQPPGSAAGGPAAGPAEAPAPAKRSRKKAAAPAVEAPAEAAGAASRAGRSRKKAVSEAPAGAAAPVGAAAPATEAPAGAEPPRKATRSRKKAVPEPEAPAPAKAAKAAKAAKKAPRKAAKAAEPGG